MSIPTEQMPEAHRVTAPRAGPTPPEVRSTAAASLAASINPGGTWSCIPWQLPSSQQHASLTGLGNPLGDRDTQEFPSHDRNPRNIPSNDWEATPERVRSHPEGSLDAAAPQYQTRGPSNSTRSGGEEGISAEGSDGAEIRVESIEQNPERTEPTVKALQTSSSLIFRDSGSGCRGGGGEGGTRAAVSLHLCSRFDCEQILRATLQEKVPGAYLSQGINECAHLFRGLRLRRAMFSFCCV